MLKKKIYYVQLENLDVEAPIYVPSIEDAIGKTIIYDLTRFLKGKNCEAKFKIIKKGDSLFAIMYSFMIYPSFIRKMIVKNCSIVEDSFLVTCQDAILRIKPFLMTRKKVHRSVRKALRNQTKDFIIKTFEKMDRQKVFQEILSMNLQKTLGKKLKKIYPLSVCEIRVVRVENFKQNPSTQ